MQQLQTSRVKQLENKVENKMQLDKQICNLPKK
jgi:hypothetical protein